MERVGRSVPSRDVASRGSLLCGNGILDALWRRLRGDLIEGEDLDYIENELGIGVKNGEHRRNIVTRGIRLGDLRRKRFRVGETVLEYDRPRPPCRHVQDLSERGMTRALKGRGGICARVVQAGSIRSEDAIETE